MELFEKEVKRLNQDQKFTEFLSAKEEEEKLLNTLLEDSEKQGIEKGEKQGVEKGKNERTIEIAQNMLKNNMSSDMISKLTGLSISEIEALK